MTNAEQILAAVTDGMVFMLGLYEVTLSNPQAAGDTFSADLVVTLGGVVVWNDDAQVVRPPLLVPDPEGDFIKPEHIFIDPVTLEEKLIPETSFSSDPLAAIKEIITSTISALIK